MHVGSNCIGIGAIVFGCCVAAHAADQTPPPARPEPETSNEAAPATRKQLRIQLTIPQRTPAPPAETPAPKPPQTQAWSPVEIAAARDRCSAILKRINAVAIPETPMRDGACGTPAPIQLISIGKNPEVALSPPAIINCDMAEMLQNWMQADVQQLARKHLGGEVIKIEVMSSYSCRAAYGRTGNKLSEHGLANAVDIRGFVASNGTAAYVLEDWGTPQREIVARIAAAKAKAEKALAAQQAAEKAAQAAQMSGKNDTSRTAAPPPAATASTVGAPAAGIARSTIVDGLPKLTVTLPGGSRAQDDAEDPRAGFSVAPNRLGGPDATNGARKTAAAQRPDKEAFLHAVHASACRTFATTLGPEANAAHRNHLHVDLAARKTDTKICD